MHHDVVVSTYGRGLYILRDITTLEQRRSDVADGGEPPVRAAPGCRVARSGSVEFTTHA